MNKIIRSSIAILYVLFLISVLTGCYDSHEIEDLAYVIAIGIDEAEGDNFSLTFQTAVPQAITGGGGEGTDITSYKTDNFLSGFKKSGQYLSRNIDLSHTKVIVVSEDIAKNGITAFINGLQQEMKIRQDINIIVAAEGAKKYLESIQPKLSSNPSKYFELLFQSYQSDFLIPEARLEEYLFRARNKDAQPLALYTAVDKTIIETKKPEDSGEEGNKDSGGNEKKKGGEEDSKKEKDEDQKKMSLSGLAVFKSDKMVGRLTQKEASIFALMMGSNNINLDIVDPFDNRFKVLSNLKKERSSRTKVTFKNGKPIITIDLNLDINVQSAQSDYDYGNPKNADILNKAYKEMLEKEIEKLLRKVTYEYKSDIFGFGIIARKNFLTIDDWEKANWTDVFPEAKYIVRLNTEVFQRG